MDIKRIQIKFFKKGSFSSVSNEGIRHVKALPYLSIVQSVEGSYDVALGDQKPQRTGDGGFFIAPAEIRQAIVHHVNPKSEKMSARWIFVDAEINGLEPLDSLYRFPAVIRDGNAAELQRIFDRLFATDDIWENYGDCYHLLGALLKQASPLRKEPHTGVQAAVLYIKENYEKPISVAHLARLASTSPSNLYSLFQKHLGSSPIAYLNHYRLSIAAEKLTESNQAICGISDSVGIGDAFYFSKLFKKAYGCTPKEYRRIYQNHS